jgi:hypothetical protein
VQTSRHAAVDAPHSTAREYGGVLGDPEGLKPVCTAVVSGTFPVGQKHPVASQSKPCSAVDGTLPIGQLETAVRTNA